MKNSFRVQLACGIAMAALCAVAASAQNTSDASSAPPAEAFRVLPPADAPGPQISRYLLNQTDLAWSQDELRVEHWSQIKSEADLLRLRAQLKQSLLRMMGGLPTVKTDLHAAITGRIQGNGYHIEKLLYQSLPGYYVTALVYVPENGEKIHPAILVPAGHATNGKDHYQALSERLALRGYLVIAWDPVGQGERSQFWDAKENKSRYNLVCGEHAVLGNLAYLAGANLARWEVWDGIRAVDYLLTRPDVDPNRINITGTSGGGTQTALIGALDDRIKVIIPSCYITALPMRVANRIFADYDSDPEQDLFGMISNGVDNPGTILAMYPRPVMLATATLDFFPIQGSHKTYSEVSALYKRFGHADRVGFAESYNGHSYSLKNQEEALNFLDRFNGMPVRHGLPPVTPYTNAELQVTKSGQVLVDYPESYSLLHYIAAYATDAARHSHKTLAELYRGENDPDIDSWTVSQFTGGSPAREVRWEAMGSTMAGAIHIDRYVLHHSTNLEMPLLHIYSDSGHPRGAVLWFSLEVEGKASEKDWPRIAKLISDGYEVYSFDFRGLGENQMNFRVDSFDRGSHHNGSFDEAYVNPLGGVLADYVYNTLLTGRPYFFQLMDDIKIAELFVRNRDAHQPREPITLAATGDAYTLAVRFKQIDPRVKILASDSAPVLNWAALVSSGQEQWPIAFLMPYGALLQ